MDATGNVYNLASPEAFPGTYGNARIGMTAGHSGKGRLWLKNPDGVVIELWTQMRGLALSGGVDGILIQWDDGGGAVVEIGFTSVMRRTLTLVSPLWSFLTTTLGAGGLACTAAGTNRAAIIHPGLRAPATPCFLLRV